MQRLFRALCQELTAGTGASETCAGGACLSCLGLVQEANGQLFGRNGSISCSHLLSRTPYGQVHVLKTPRVLCLMARRESRLPPLLLTHHLHTALSLPGEGQPIVELPPLGGDERREEVQTYESRLKLDCGSISHAMHQRCREGGAFTETAALS